MGKGFTVRSTEIRLLGLPCEDSYHIFPVSNMNIVADGVHRDCNNGEIVDASLKGLLNSFYYPKPSPAEKAAQIFTGNFHHSFFSNYMLLEDSREDGPDEQTIRKTFETINSKDIREYNEREGFSYPPKDYTINYPAGCTASVTFENKGLLYWGYIADCGVAIVDDKGNLVFRTKDEGPGKIGDYSCDVKSLGLSWKDSEGRAFTRKNFRNNPSEPRAVGILNGMPEAMHYVRTGVQEINSKDYLLVYTDGLGEIIFGNDGDINGEVADKLKQKDFRGLERLCKKKIKKEGTLVVEGLF
ncbi:MAG: hypothetical protein ABIH59_02820 [archaeon]